MTTTTPLAERACRRCRHAQGDRCRREYPKAFTFRYETGYTDSDFCGPNRRYFERANPLHKMLAAIRSRSQDNGGEG